MANDKLPAAAAPLKALVLTLPEDLASTRNSANSTLDPDVASAAMRKKCAALVERMLGPRDSPHPNGHRFADENLNVLAEVLEQMTASDVEDAQVKRESDRQSDRETQRQTVSDVGGQQEDATTPVVSPDSDEDSDPLSIFSSSLLPLFNHHVPSHGSPSALFTYTPPSSSLFPTPVPFQVRIPPQSHTSLFAHYQWDSGTRLADKIALGEIDVKGLRILELGAGTGLPGLMAARCGAEMVVLSDFDDVEMMRNLSSNISLALPEELRPRVVAIGHTWGEDPSPLQAATPNKTYPLLLLADTLWSSSSHPALLTSLAALLSHTPSSRIQIVTGLHSGRACVRAFLRLAEQAGLVVDGQWEEVGSGVGRRAWGWDFEVKKEREEEVEDGGERNKWVVKGRLRWRREGDLAA